MVALHSQGVNSNSLTSTLFILAKSHINRNNLSQSSPSSFQGQTDGSYPPPTCRQSLFGLLILNYRSKNTLNIRNDA